MSDKKDMIQRSISEMPDQEENKKQKPRSNSLHKLDIQRRSSDTNAFEELLQCGICYERLQDPRMLPCQHTFCLSCLQEFVKSIERRMLTKNQVFPNPNDINRIHVSLSCPTCQSVMNINCKYSSLNELPKNIYIDNLLKLTENQCTSPTSTSSPTLRCAKCQTICPLPGKSCEHCMQVFCTVCWTEHLSTLNNNIKTLLEHLLESETKLINRIDDFNVQCQIVSVDIEKATENHILKLQEKKKHTLQQVEYLKNCEQKNIEDLQIRIKKLSTEVKTLKLDEIGNEEYKVNTFMNYHRATSKILDDVSRWGNSHILFDNNTFQVINSNQIYSDETDYVSNGTDTPFESIDSMATYYREKAFKTKLVWNRCPRPAGLGIPPWAPNHLYIATTNRKVVLIMDRTISKVVAKLTTPEMHCPQCIAFSADRLEVYVTDKSKHCIHVFSNDGEYKRTLCSFGSKQGELRNPEGIAVTQDNNLVVCDSGNDRVVIVNPEDGKQISLLAGSINRTPFQIPTGVAVFGDRIIVADTGNHTIKVYSSAGKQLLEFGTTGTGRGQFRTAEVVTCDPMGFIFVGDSGNGRIQIFTPDGNIVRELNSQGKTSEKFLWISGLVVSQQLEIIATDCKQKCLQIFNNYNTF